MDGTVIHFMHVKYNASALQAENMKYSLTELFSQLTSVKLKE